MERVRDAVKLEVLDGPARRSAPQTSCGEFSASLLLESLGASSGNMEHHRVRIDPRGLSGQAANFEGPLDLLLHLIKKHEVEHLRHPDRAHHRSSTSTTST